MQFFAVFAAIMALTAAMPAKSEWSLHEITAALENPSTSPALVPYLEHGLNQIMDALYSGFQIESVAIPLPAEIVSPTPVIVEEAAVAPVESAPVESAPVVSAPAPALSSPLVQIIVNVNQQEQAAEVVPRPVPSPAVVPEINPTPVVVVDEPAAPIVPTPVVVVDEPAAPIVPTPVVVVDEPAAPIVPTPVVVVEKPAEEISVNPVPVVESNPIDVIAIAAPEVNPVDIKNPVPIPANPAGEVESIWV